MGRQCKALLVVVVVVVVVVVLFWGGGGPLFSSSFHLFLFRLLIGHQKNEKESGRYRRRRE